MAWVPNRIAWKRAFAAIVAPSAELRKVCHRPRHRLSSTTATNQRGDARYATKETNAGVRVVAGFFDSSLAPASNW